MRRASSESDIFESRNSTLGRGKIFGKSQRQERKRKSKRRDERGERGLQEAREGDNMRNIGKRFVRKQT